MNGTTFFKELVAFFVFIIAQIGIFQYFTLYSIATPFVFPLFLLFLPTTIKPPIVYVIAFIFGFLLDLLMNSYGIHSFCCVLLVAIRPFWILLVTPQISEDELEQMRLNDQNLAWQLSYLIPLLFVYTFTYSMLTEFSLQNVLRMFIRGLSSGFYSAFFCLMITILFYRKIAR
ncbi:MAG: hypothetical protein NZ108_06540 [Bacteroidia bacterium]|nr:hypothetical protein [Bacteroidia bacterium]